MNYVSIKLPCSSIFVTTEAYTKYSRRYEIYPEEHRSPQPRRVGLLDKSVVVDLSAFHYFLASSPGPALVMVFSESSCWHFEIKNFG